MSQQQQNQINLLLLKVAALETDLKAARTHFDERLAVLERQYKEQKTLTLKKASA